MFIIVSIPHPVTLAGRVIPISLGGLTTSGSAAGIFHASGPCKDSAVFVRSENYKHYDAEVARFKAKTCNF